jgi:membrane protein required for colicin V production
MWIDILFLILLVIAIYKGWSHGITISLFTAAAWILGILGALKLSAVVALYMRDNLNLQSQYTPVISFILVFIIIAFMVYMLGKALEKIIEIAQLGFINRALGALLKVMVFALMFSFFIWLINQAGFISPETKTESKTFSYLLPMADAAIHFFDQYLPAVKSIFFDIENFFEELAMKV